MRSYGEARSNARTATRALPLIAAALLLAAAAMGPLRGSAHEPDAEERALMSLIDADLALARMAGEQGARAAFGSRLLAGGIVLQSGSGRVATKRGEPASADDGEPRFGWKPAQAGVARSGDLGYTLGPMAAGDATRPDAARHGVYFSAWQRDATGTWRIALNAHAFTPEAVDFAALGAAPRAHFAGARAAARERKALLQREANALGAESPHPLPLAPSVLFFRDGEPPVTGRAAVAARLGETARRVAWTPVDARLSRAADVAVTHGRLGEPRADEHADRGVYVHLWLRDAQGRWQLACILETRGAS